MKRLESVLIRTLEILSTICFSIMFVLIVAQVALRYGFNESIGGANELATILFAYTSALGIAIAIAKREHMAITWFTQRLSSTPRKIVDIMGLLLLGAVNIVIFYYSLKWIGVTGDRMISVLQVPRWTAQVAIPIGAGASAIFCIIKLYLGLTGEEELGIPWMQEG
jgi:TRAP-type C4-dicarboxylate transport system permease small subunit